MFRLLCVVGILYLAGPFLLTCGLGLYALSEPTLRAKMLPPEGGYKPDPRLDKAYDELMAYEREDAERDAREAKRKADKHLLDAQKRVDEATKARPKRRNARPFGGGEL